jgi:hypothetical protein
MSIAPKSNTFDRPLTPRDRKFVTAYVKTSKKAKAMRIADPTLAAASAGVVASNTLRNINVQKAIEDALVNHGLTPDHAIAELSKLVDQDEELAVKHRAISTTLELMGWRKSDKPMVSIEMTGFMGKSRTILDGETVQTTNQ